MLPRLLAPLVVECLAILRRRGPPILLVEPDKAKGQDKISGDFIVASEKSQATLPPIHTYVAPTIVPTTKPTQTIRVQSVHTENKSTFQRRHRSKAAKRSHPAQITEASARDTEDGAGGGVAAAAFAFAKSSCSSCVDVTCSCPDIILSLIHI